MEQFTLRLIIISYVSGIVMSSDDKFNPFNNRKAWIWYCLFAVGSYLSFDGFFECSRLLESGDLDGCAQYVVLRIYEFAAILAIILLGVLISPGLSRQQRNDS